MVKKVTFFTTEDLHGKLREKCKAENCSQQKLIESMLEKTLNTGTSTGTGAGTDTGDNRIIRIRKSSAEPEKPKLDVHECPTCKTVTIGDAIIREGAPKVVEKEKPREPGSYTHEELANQIGWKHCPTCEHSHRLNPDKDDDCPECDYRRYSNWKRCPNCGYDYAEGEY
ncbi:MAG: hypothetical protein ABIH76_00615 [Candidatus Bathyarchaeota archaeon]